MRALTGLAVMVLVGGAGVATAAPGGFVFTPPPGWVDMSPDAPEANRQKASPEMRAGGPGSWGSVARSAIMGGVAGGIAVVLVALIKRSRSGRAT